MKHFINGFRKSYKEQTKLQAAKNGMSEKEFHHLNIAGWLVITTLLAFVLRLFRR